MGVLYLDGGGDLFQFHLNAYNVLLVEETPAANKVQRVKNAFYSPVTGLEMDETAPARQGAATTHKTRQEEAQALKNGVKRWPWLIFQRKGRRQEVERMHFTTFFLLLFLRR